jgi:O-antigen ligase
LSGLAISADSVPRAKSSAQPEAALIERARNRLIANSAIALAVFLGGFVLFEPAPYELYLCLLLVVWTIFGMRVPSTVFPLLVLFTLFNAGGIISAFQIGDWQRGVIYVAVSYFLALTAVFFACVIAADMGRLRLIFRVYVVSAAITTTLGIAGYFGVPGFQMFTKFMRASGAFQDPNVYGPFLIAPILYLIYGIVSRGPGLLLLARCAVLLLLLAGLFLAFSRGAWGLAVVCVLIFYALLIINERKAVVRLKYLVIAAIGLAMVILLLLAALQVPAISELFTVRAKVVQNYDAGQLGRFARFYYGYLMAPEHPFGIGPLEFGFIMGEDTHHAFLKALMDYGWIGFACWITMLAWTLAGGFKMLFRQRPWLPYFQIAYVVFVGHIFLGMVIDTDHWRHHYLLIGIIWGCMALEANWQRQRRPGLLERVARRSEITTSPVIAGA